MNQTNQTYQTTQIPQFVYLKCYDELYKTYETDRLILQRTNESDFEPLGKIIFNKNVNMYFQRPVMYLDTIASAINYVRNHNYCTVSFTIKLKTNTTPIPIGQIGYYYADYTSKEIGVFYYIDENYHKKGYASEAAVPLIRHLFENLPITNTLKIDFNENNIASRKTALKICNDIMKYHPDYVFGELTPFTDKYTLSDEPPVWGNVKYYFDGFDRKCFVLYPENFFNKTKYFELLSNGYFIKKTT